MKVKCRICGKIEDTDQWINGHEMEENQMCFSCNHWRGQHETDLNERGEHNYAIVNGEHYVLAPHTDSYFKGFGGHMFHFKFFDGTEKYCDNVWYQGDMKREAHPHWREVMPDNAEIVYDKPRKVEDLPF